MKTLALLPLCSVLLGCASPALATQEGADESTTAESPLEDGFTPIRFGDPEGPLAYSVPLIEGATYDASITSPDELLGQAVGTRLAHHAEIVACFEQWAAESDRMQLVPMGRTHEGRALIHAVISSPANLARLDDQLAAMNRLADPRGLSDESGALSAAKPVAWMSYSIHGDELSGSDAALALGHYLVAGQGEVVERMLDELYIVIDPCMNPDGRERIIGMVEQSAGYTPSLDYASMHRGRWPFGRGNHYLFDMNRDWMAGTQPETRARWRAVQRYHPLLFVDAHEMGSLDTYLFYPQAAPIHTHFPAGTVAKQGVVAAAISQAFDALGWGYYTREWADGWAPFYSDAWGSLNGAVGVLYEQSRTAGFPLKRESGKVLTYRQAVHHQLTASLASLEALQANADTWMREYIDGRKANCATDGEWGQRQFVLRSGDRPTRERALLATLLAQGVEVYRAQDAFTLTKVQSHLGADADSMEFPAGSFVIPASQPNGPLVRAFLDFDPRLDAESLLRERESLEQKNESKIYDLTAWSLPHALDVASWWGDGEGLALEALDSIPPLPAPTADATQNAYAWLVDGRDDSAVAFAARAMELGLQVQWADESFRSNGRDYARGTLMVNRHENDLESAELAKLVERAARTSGAQAVATTTGRSPDEGPDLGGQHFHLLARPRVAVVGNTPVASDSYGHLWFALDRVIGVPFSIIDAQSGADLRRFNVIVLPPGAGELVSEWKDELIEWVEAGGTLVACEDAAAACTREQVGLSASVLRRDALGELDSFAKSLERERAAHEVAIDEDYVWSGSREQAADDADAQAETDEEPEELDEDQLAEADRWARRFSPAGANVLAEADLHHWLTSGCDEQLPVPIANSRVFLSQTPVQTAVRLAPSADLRLGGLIWPEYRERLADSAWLTAESRGNGQLVLFAGMPAFRGYSLATGRLFANAVIYGPGLGADQPIGW